MTCQSKTWWSSQEKLELLIRLIKLMCSCWLTQNLCPCYSHSEALTLQCFPTSQGPPHRCDTAQSYLCPLGHGINSRNVWHGARNVWQLPPLLAAPVTSPDCGLMGSFSTQQPPLALRCLWAHLSPFGLRLLPEGKGRALPSLLRRPLFHSDILSDPLFFSLWCLKINASPPRGYCRAACMNWEINKRGSVHATFLAANAHQSCPSYTVFFLLHVLYWNSYKGKKFQLAAVFSTGFSSATCYEGVWFKKY